VEAYDPKTDSWATKADMPTARAGMAVCALDGIIYAIAGGGSTDYATVEAYDPKSDTWTTKSKLPKACHWLTTSVANGLVYAFHGTNTFAYDPTTDHWTTKASFSPWSYGLMSTTVDGIVYLFGGMTRDYTGSYDFVLAYDPTQDRFTTRRRMPRTRLTSACEVIDGKVYLAGGISKEPVVNPDAVYYKVLDVFDPQGGVTAQILSLTRESTNRVRLVWQGEAGVRYSVQSRRDVATGSWVRLMLSTGGYTIVATNALVEGAWTVPAADTNRFFRVVEN